MRKPALLLLLLLVGCAEPPAPPPGRVVVAPGVALDLPPPASLGREIEAVQMVTARHGAQSFTFEAHLSVTNERVLLAGIDGFGQRLMELRWTGATLTLSAHWNPQRRQPPHQWDGEADPALPPLGFATAAHRLERNAILSNSFAFGGLVLSA